MSRDSEITNKININFNQVDDCLLLHPSKIKFYKEKSFNTHNQFLGFLLLGGWLACLLLLGFFLSSLYNSIHSVYSIILLLFLLFFIFENVLYRQLGAQLMGFFLGFLSSKSNLIHENKEN